MAETKLYQDELFVSAHYAYHPPPAVEYDCRLDALIEDSNRALERAIAEIEADGKEIVGIVGLFSGGNDSTTLAHMFRTRVSHFAHANTGIGIEKTREYVRDTCKAWGVPLIEKHPPAGVTYRELVLGQSKTKTPRAKRLIVWPGGFPGAGAHGLFFGRIKERALWAVRNELVSNPRKQRVIFLAGRRASESAARTAKTKKGTMRHVERVGSIVYVSPLLNWSKLDLNDYRRRFPDAPRNEVSDTLHMSGECLCGAYAHEGELDEIAFWYPDTAKEIRELEGEVQALQSAGMLPDVKPEHCVWGWNGNGKCVGGFCNN